MNLLTYAWVPTRSDSGTLQKIAPFQIGDPVFSPADIVSPRPDFRGALYQFLIGLLQTTCAPVDTQEWVERFQAPPAPEQLQKAFAAWEPAFELDPVSGPAFFQDLDPLVGAEPCEIARLLIDNPGDKTVADNNDHFIHGGSIEALCPACAATALLTLQINAPGGGAGHRVSVRGGGPLTTLRLPRDTTERTGTLWQKLWSNVMPAEYLNYRKPKRREDILPWFADTRTSDPKGAGDTTPAEAHPLQAYWSMPRRIRLDWADAVPATCDLCGEPNERCVRRYRTRPYGVNYTGAWIHPLTPYSYDPKQDNLPISLKGQRGGIGYRQWAGLAIGDASRNPAAARVVAFFNQVAPELPEAAREAQLWCFGYDMDNMKSRCWYDGTLPLPNVPPEQLPKLSAAVKRLLDAAGELAFAVKRSVGAATHPQGTGDPAVGQSFWGESEAIFYAFLEDVMRRGPEDEQEMAEAYSAWLLAASHLGLQLFDRWVLAIPMEINDMRKVVKARVSLQRASYGGKGKALRAWIETRIEARIAARQRAEAA